MTQSQLICTVLDVKREHVMVHQRDGPEFGYRLGNLAAFFVHGDERQLCVALCRERSVNS